MICRRDTATVLAALAVAGSLLLGAVAPARANLLQPGPGKTFFGLTDSGVTSQFTEFSETVGKHPAVIETFRAWDADLKGSIKRWQSAIARPVLHISTADPNDGHALITPRGIALGKGDDYLVWLNRLFWKRGMRAYLRPLGEPNRCLNIYAAYDCTGNLKAGYLRPYWYKRAFRRMYIVLHGGGKLEKVNRRLARAGLQPLKSQSGEPPAGLPRSPIVVMWSPLPAGSPEIRKNLPGFFYPGRRYVDWVGTDFYSDYPDWKSLTDLYRRFAARERKPFTLTEWALNSSDDSRFVKRLFVWAQRHPRCRMLIYYQDFGAYNSYRLQNYPASLAIVQRKLRSPSFPAYTFEPPQPPPPPPGGLSP
jgi:Glycosyl hydrolase family 26